MSFISVSDSHSPIGVFDSGLGGLTVAKALLRALPRERILYLGDTARVPYGARSAETVVRYARGCVRLLLERGVKAVVVACNTVSAVAMEALQAELPLPVLGVIDPGAEAAVQAVSRHAARFGRARVGVLGTVGTIASGAYPRAIARLSPFVEVVGQAAPLLVPLVEDGWLTGEVPELVVKRYLDPLVRAEVDAVVLGCTHYPLLTPLVSHVLDTLTQAHIPIVDSAEATARVVRHWIEQGWSK